MEEKREEVMTEMKKRASRLVEGTIGRNRPLFRGL
jgi:hypothetical protein